MYSVYGIYLGLTESTISDLRDLCRLYTGTLRVGSLQSSGLWAYQDLLEGREYMRPTWFEHVWSQCRYEPRSISVAPSTNMILTWA